jgi:hypothetical protein
VLLDLAEEVILPSFLDQSLLRRYSDTTYFFYEAQVVEVGSGTDKKLGIVGRFIKDTTLVREQIYDEEKGLVHDRESIRSSPSAVFLLILNNHKLIYLHETANAPNLQAFRSTTEKFIRQKHRNFIDELYKKKRKEYEAGDSEAITKKALYEEFPRPNINIIPLSSEESFKDFVKRYDILRSVQTKLVQTNDEFDTDAFFSQLREGMDEIGSSRTTLSHNNKKGLVKEKVLKQLAPLVGQGNTLIMLDGKDSEGDSLKGNNENFKVRVPVEEELSDNLPDIAKQIYRSFSKLSRRGVVKIADVGSSVIEKIAKLKSHMRGKGE